MPPAYPPIADYALIGDCRSAALVSRDGAIDWLCWPRFDSPSIFAALLDRKRGGCFWVRPTAPYRVERRYLPATNVIEMVFHTAAGSVALRDMLVVLSEQEKHTFLLAEHELLREIEGLSGAVELDIWYDPRPDFGRSRPPLRDRGPLGLWSTAGRAQLILRSELPLRMAPDGGAGGQARISAGDRHYLSLSYAAEAPAVMPALGAAARDRAERTARWWRGWAQHCRYAGPYRETVERSALTLKLLNYAPSGAIIAAPTTSLPEVLGGQKNWDYRYCWLRDAALTLRALFGLGYDAEAEAFLNWQLHATRLTQPELRILYDVYGLDRLPECELPELDGYARSRPVRIGNAAHDQLQLDVYGEVADAAWQYVQRGGRLDRDSRRLLAGIGKTVCKRWREPDRGIWESRGPSRQYTHSKVLCWVALDRLLHLHDAHVLNLPADRLRAERAALRDEIDRHGYNTRLASYTQTFDGEQPDASLLNLLLHGYLGCDDSHARSTMAYIQERLGIGPLIYRKLPVDEHGQPTGEGAFGICSFWMVECEALVGDYTRAIARFEHLLGHANDIGLFAEEIDPQSGAALGNFPQAFTHVGLVNAALALA